MGSRSRSRSHSRSRRSRSRDRNRGSPERAQGRRSRSHSPPRRRRRRFDGPRLSSPEKARQPAAPQGDRDGQRLREKEGGRPAVQKKARDLSHLVSGSGHGGPIQWGKQEEVEEELKDESPKEVEKPNFGLSGALAKDSATGNTYKGIVLKWSEPADARQPTKRWRLYVFKAGQLIATLHVHRQSAYLVGREKKIADILVEHPSCSKQHAVLQFRLKETVAEDGIKKIREVRPYIMDLESTNGTFLNGERIEHSRYIELLEKDMLRFGESTREYILLSADQQ